VDKSDVVCYVKIQQNYSQVQNSYRCCKGTRVPALGVETWTEKAETAECPKAEALKCGTNLPPSCFSHVISGSMFWDK